LNNIKEIEEIRYNILLNIYTKTGISPYDFQQWHYDNMFLRCSLDINKLMKFLKPNPEEVFPLHMEKNVSQILYLYTIISA
jgi:hypothetical protein